MDVEPSHSTRPKNLAPSSWPGSGRTWLAWPMNATAHNEIAELACMSALAQWLARWQPIQIHRAVLRGAEPAVVAAALGDDITQTFGRWCSWALEQRDSVVCGRPGVTAKEYETVAAVFAAAGVVVPALRRAVT